MAEATFWARDLINTPAEDMGPQHLAAEAAAMASVHTGMLAALALHSVHMHVQTCDASAPPSHKHACAVSQL